MTQAAAHAIPDGDVAVEFQLLRADGHPQHPECRSTGFGYRGHAGATGAVEWMAVSNLSGERSAKPTAADLGIDLTALEWLRTGDERDVIEVAQPANPPYWAEGDWVLMRHARRPDGVQVYDRNEWDCFLFALIHGEFDDIAHAGDAQSDVLTGGS